MKPQPSSVRNELNLPICRQCQRLMTIARIGPDWLRDEGSEIQTFECVACGGSVTRSVPGGDRGR